GVVNALDHAGQDEAGFDAVLIRINAYDKMRGATILCARLLYGVECSKTLITGSSENHVCAFSYLGQRKLFSFTGIIPRAVCNANVVLNDAYVRVNRARALFVALLEPVYERNVHAAYESYCSRLGCLRGYHAY